MIKPTHFHVRFEEITQDWIQNAIVVGLYYNIDQELCRKYCCFFENYEDFKDYFENTYCCHYDIYKLEDSLNEQQIDEIENKILSKYKSNTQYQQENLSNNSL